MPHNTKPPETNDDNENVRGRGVLVRRAAAVAILTFSIAGIIWLVSAFLANGPRVSTSKGSEPLVISSREIDIAYTAWNASSI